MGDRKREVIGRTREGEEIVALTESKRQVVVQGSERELRDKLAKARVELASLEPQFEAHIANARAALRQQRREKELEIADIEEVLGESPTGNG